MDLIRQPNNSHLCAHACVAMVCNITLAEAIELLGHNHETSTGEIYDALMEFGLDGVSVMNGQPIPGRTSIVLFTNGKRGHWVVYHNNKYYDPRAGVFRQVPNYLQNTYIKKHILVKVD